MATVGFSIRIETSMRKKLEELASANFRTLNGEINKALDFYIKYGQGEPVKYDHEIIDVDNELVRLKDVHNEHLEFKRVEEVLNTDNFSDDEIEEF